jgi:hypothetical protein
MRRMRRTVLGPRRWWAPVGPAARPGLQLLRHANELMNAGEYAPAGAELRNLAQVGEAAGVPQSPHVYLLAGRAHFLAGQPEEGMQDLKRGVEAAAHFDRMYRLAGAAPRLASEMREHGYAKEADAFIGLVEAAFHRPLASSAPAQHARRLPPKCPYCGGTIHAGEAEWVDEGSVACDHCGSTVQATEG